MGTKDWKANIGEALSTPYDPYQVTSPKHNLRRILGDRLLKRQKFTPRNGQYPHSQGLADLLDTGIGLYSHYQANEADNKRIAAEQDEYSKGIGSAMDMMNPSQVEGPANRYPPAENSYQPGETPLAYQSAPDLTSPPANFNPDMGDYGGQMQEENVGEMIEKPGDRMGAIRELLSSKNVRLQQFGMAELQRFREEQASTSAADLKHTRALELQGLKNTGGGGTNEMDNYQAMKKENPALEMTFEGFMKKKLAGTDPASVKGMRYLQSIRENPDLTNKQKEARIAEYWREKRSEKSLDLGGSHLLVESGKEIPKTLAPDKTPAYLSEAETKKSEAKWTHKQKISIPRDRADIRQMGRQQKKIKHFTALAKKEAKNMSATGITGKISSFVPGTPGYRLQKYLQAIKSNVSFDKLISIKKAGATLGALSTYEAELLASVNGALDSGDPKVMLDAIREVEELYQNMIDDAGVLFEEEYGQGWQMVKKKNGGSAPAKPQGKVTEQAEIDELEELRRWKKERENK
jgi:hypothetical protein